MTNLVNFDLDVWIAMHEDLKTSRRMRLMFDHLAAEMELYIRGGTPEGAKKGVRK